MIDLKHAAGFLSFAFGMLAQIPELLPTDCHITLVNWLAANMLAHV
jgi:hypothetical protein